MAFRNWWCSATRIETSVSFRYTPSGSSAWRKPMQLVWPHEIAGQTARFIYSDHESRARLHHDRVDDHHHARCCACQHCCAKHACLRSEQSSEQCGARTVTHHTDCKK